jgi:hypothetical protein
MVVGATGGAPAILPVVTSSARGALTPPVVIAKALPPGAKFKTVDGVGIVLLMICSTVPANISWVCLSPAIFSADGKYAAQSGSSCAALARHAVAALILPDSTIPKSFLSTEAALESRSICAAVASASVLVCINGALAASRASPACETFKACSAVAVWRSNACCWAMRLAIWPACCIAGAKKLPCCGARA